MFKGVALAFAMLLGGSPGVLLYANDSVEESLMVAQAGRTIKGLVTDANGEPLIGCNVVVVGSNAGVITDIDGRFAECSCGCKNKLELLISGMQIRLSI